MLYYFIWEIKEYQREFESFAKCKIKVLQTDNSSEYCNQKFDLYLRKNGIVQRLTAPCKPQDN